MAKANQGGLKWRAVICLGDLEHHNYGRPLNSSGSKTSTIVMPLICTSMDSWSWYHAGWVLDCLLCWYFSFPPPEKPPLIWFLVSPTSKETLLDLPTCFIPYLFTCPPPHIYVWPTRGRWCRWIKGFTLSPHHRKEIVTTVDIFHFFLNLQRAITVLQQMEAILENMMEAFILVKKRISFFNFFNKF